MALTDFQIQTLGESAKHNIGKETHVWLLGSRVDDTLKAAILSRLAYFTAIKISAVGAGHARDEETTTLQIAAQISRAWPAPTVSCVAPAWEYSSFPKYKKNAHTTSARI